MSNTVSFFVCFAAFGAGVWLNVDGWFRLYFTIRNLKEEKHKKLEARDKEIRQSKKEAEQLALQREMVQVMKHAHSGDNE